MLLRLLEEIGTAVVDTGCIKRVSGPVWLDSFVNSLDINTRKMISIKKSGNVFKFGGGTRKQSIGLYSIPCSLKGKNIELSHLTKTLGFGVEVVLLFFPPLKPF